MIGAFVGSLFFVTGLFYLDSNRFVKRVKKAMDESLLERKLEENFEHFGEKENYDSLVKNLSSLFSNPTQIYFYRHYQKQVDNHNYYK